MRESIISINNVTKRFGNLTAVDNICLNVFQGELFALLGPNGAGKSTTIKMLTTLLKPTSGTLLLAGHDVVKESHAARNSFGIVFQDTSLDEELTAYENMALHAALYSVPKDKAEGRIEQMLTLVELWDRRKSLVKTFSGGMKRRLEIARGLLHHPKILFLDEPTLGLDTQTRNMLWEYIITVNKNEGMTVFFTTHYLQEAESVAHRIAIVDHGKIVAMGDAAQLKEKTGTSSLEAAYLQLTGKQLRDETLDAAESSRERIRAFRRIRNQ